METRRPPNSSFSLSGFMESAKEAKTVIETKAPSSSLVRSLLSLKGGSARMSLFKATPPENITPVMVCPVHSSLVIPSLSALGVARLGDPVGEALALVRALLGVVGRRLAQPDFWLPVYATPKSSKT